MGQRLIDADKVIKEQRRIMESLYGSSIAEIKIHMDIDDSFSVPMHAMESYAKAKQFFFGLKGILDAAPTVDAVPVVRCRECKHFNLERMECENEVMITDHEGGASYSLNFCPDDFCSYGERKEDTPHEQA